VLYECPVHRSGRTGFPLPAQDGRAPSLPLGRRWRQPVTSGFGAGSFCRDSARYCTTMEEPASLSKPVERFVCLDEGLLRQVQRIGVGARQPKHQVVDGLLIPVDQNGIGVYIPRKNGGNNLMIAYLIHEPA